MKISRLLLMAAALTFLGAACTGGGASQEESAVPPPAPMEAATATDAPVQQVETAVPAPTAIETVAEDTGEFDPTGPIPTGGSALHASNPTEYQAAAGQPQVVEFFAFW